MTLLDTPQTVEMLRFIQDRGGKVSIEAFNAAFPDSRRWDRDLIREKCVAAVDLRAVQMEDASGIQPMAYALLPMGEAVLATKEQGKQSQNEVGKPVSREKGPHRNEGRAEKAGKLAALISAVCGALAAVVELIRALLR